MLIPGHAWCLIVGGLRFSRSCIGCVILIALASLKVLLTDLLLLTLLCDIQRGNEDPGKSIRGSVSNK
uniref:Uncharacterized protein n=1 Tax=Magallana gigas TaxID=29159 RepID=K1PMI6_MAGGI